MSKSESRPWGRYEVLSEFLPSRDSSRIQVKVKRIIVNPGERISYQYHQHRVEYWWAVEGSGIITINDHESEFKAGNRAMIPSYVKHRVQADPDCRLVFIEIQESAGVNGYLDEDDIIRIEDDYGR